MNNTKKYRRGERGEEEETVVVVSRRQQQSETNVGVYVSGTDTYSSSTVHVCFYCIDHHAYVGEQRRKRKRTISYSFLSVFSSSFCCY